MKNQFQAIMILFYIGGIMITKHLPMLDIEKTAKSGQCFRLVKINDTHFRLVAFAKRLDIFIQKDGFLSFSCDEAEFSRIWRPYFDLDSDYAPFHDVGDDPFMQRAIQKGFGIRMLRQAPFETLISFIVSQRKNIPAIQKSIELLCRRFGSPIDKECYAFPAAEQLAQASLPALYDCALGYRAPYILASARQAAENEALLCDFAALCDKDLIQALCAFKGVGVKVASCVALFAYHRLSIFPRDVWILRMEETHYGGRFPEETYPDCAGLLQQYAFFLMREEQRL